MQRSVIALVLLVVVGVAGYAARGLVDDGADDQQPVVEPTRPVLPTAEPASPVPSAAAGSASRPAMDVRSNVDPNLRKCVDERNRVVYQDVPCGANSREVPLDLDAGHMPAEGIEKPQRR